MKIAKIDIKGVIVSNDDIWIYDWFEIDAVSPKGVIKQLEENGGEDIEVHINSPGGDVFAGSEIYTAIKEYSGNVHVKIVGIAASAASFAAMAGDTISMSPTGQIMIHNASTVTWGDRRDHRHTADFLKTIDESIANAYRLKTGLAESELLSLMSKETYMNAQDALDKGFIDEIMFDDENQLRAAASAGLTQLLPREVIDKVRNELMNARRSKEPDEPPKNKIKEPQEPERTPTVPLSLFEKKLALRGRVLK